MSPSKTKIQPLIGNFLDFKRIDHRCSPLTLAAYQNDLEALAEWGRGHRISLAKLTKVDMRRFVSEMQKQGLADTTIRRRWSTWSQFFAYLIDEVELDDLKRSPTRGFRFPVTDTREAFHLQPEQRKQLFRHLENKATNALGKLDLALFGLLYYAGLRVSEGISRTFDDVQEGGNRLIVVGKRNKKRVVAIHPTARLWLEEWLAVRPVVEDRHLFIHPSRKKPMSRRLAGRRLKKALAAAGLGEEIVKRTSPHTLRHTRATDLRRAGYDLLVIRRFLGHAFVKTTEIYTHVDDPEVDEAVLKVD